MTASRKTIAFVLSIVMLLGICALVAGCSNDNTIKDLEQRITEFEGKLDQQKERINKLEKENESLSYKIYLSELEITSGNFYSLKDMYNKNYLTVEDLQTIADYHNNIVDCEDHLNDDVAQAIKQAWAQKLVEDGQLTAEQATADIISIVKYYGTYNNCAIVIVDRKDMYHLIGMPYTVEIGDVSFGYTSYWPQIIVWVI